MSPDSYRKHLKGHLELLSLVLGRPLLLHPLRLSNRGYECRGLLILYRIAEPIRTEWDHALAVSEVTMSRFALYLALRHRSFARS